jgi:hypothetical protein
VVAPPIIDRSEPIRSGKNLPNPQKIPAPGLHRATHQIVFTRPRVRKGSFCQPCSFSMSRQFHTHFKKRCTDAPFFHFD